MTHIPKRYFSLPDHLKLEMPNLSPTMEKVSNIYINTLQGNISEWHKKVGDAVAPGDILCGIETDKATVDFEMQEEGYIAAILYAPGTKDVPLGQPLAILVEDEADIAAFKDYKGESAPTPSAAPA